ncbi:MAG TPA: hypothetical protein VHI13_20125 [Candidatus Kapabacteria bacterium]|nr:hypothetical protein [Candidatus Kapabacteria bacterium]
MIHRIRHHVVAASLLAALAIAFATSARADCCNSVTIINSTNCTFQVHALINGVANANWTIAPGNNTFRFSQCFTVAIDVTDMCGNVHPFPGTAGPCIDVPVTTTCCVNICQTSLCQWTVTNGNCNPC